MESHEYAVGTLITALLGLTISHWLWLFTALNALFLYLSFQDPRSLKRQQSLLAPEPA